LGIADGHQEPQRRVGQEDMTQDARFSWFHSLLLPLSHQTSHCPWSLAHCSTYCSCTLKHCLLQISSSRDSDPACPALCPEPFLMPVNLPAPHIAPMISWKQAASGPGVPTQSLRYSWGRLLSEHCSRLMHYLGGPG
jgi:hypothetical protein